MFGTTIILVKQLFLTKVRRLFLIYTSGTSVSFYCYVLLTGLRVDISCFSSEDHFRIGTCTLVRFFLKSGTLCLEPTFTPGKSLFWINGHTVAYIPPPALLPSLLSCILFVIGHNSFDGWS